MAFSIRSSRKAILTAAAVAIAGVTGFAIADTMNTHVMTVSLPDGTIAQVRYVGDEAPQLSFDPEPMGLRVLSPVIARLDDDSPFAELDRMDAILDQRAASMLRQAQALTSPARGQPDGRMVADWGQPPAGVRSYVVVSTLGGEGVCTRTIRDIDPGDGKPPRVTSHASGACRETSEGERPAGPAPASDAHAVEARDQGGGSQV